MSSRSIKYTVEEAWTGNDPNGAHLRFVERNAEGDWGALLPPERSDVIEVQCFDSARI